MLKQLISGDEATAKNLAIFTRDWGYEPMWEEKDLVQGILNAIQAAVFVNDPASRKVVECNATAEALLGMPEQEIIAKSASYQEIVFESHDCKNLLDPCIEDKGQPEEGVLRLPDGRTRYITRQTFTMVLHGRTRLLQVVFDISGQKELERQLQSAQKLEAVGRLAAGIAHEINTPTQWVGDNIYFLRDVFSDIFTVLDKYEQVVQAYKSGTMRNELQDLQNYIQEIDLQFLHAEVPRALDSAQDGLDRVASIVRAMKTFSHPGSEEKRSVDVNKALESTITVARNEWKYVAEIEKDLDPDLPEIPAFEADLNQVFLNVLVNAIQAVGAKYEQTTKKGRIKLYTTYMDDTVIIGISDDGIGIAQENRQKIFDPFFTTKDIGQGMGQGLAIAHDIIVGKHGGRIEVHSEEMKGTSFIIKLPISLLE